MDQNTRRLLASIDGRLGRIERALATPTPELLDARRSYSRRDAASALGVSVWSIDRARREGLLCETRHLGPRDVRITGESLLALMQQKQASSGRVLKI